jgi:hypothetical protein
MASPGKQQMTPGRKFLGLGILFLILLLGVGIVLGGFFLGNPFTAIVQLVIIGGCLIGIVFRLKQSFQLAKGQHANKLVIITLFLIAGTCIILVHLGDVIQSNDPNYIVLAFNSFIFLSFYYAIELVVDLLKNAKTIKPVRELDLPPQ